jgi:hypothetical protein
VAEVVEIRGTLAPLPATGPVQLEALLAWVQGRHRDARGYGNPRARAAACNAYTGVEREIEALLLQAGRGEG